MTTDRCSMRPASRSARRSDGTATPPCRSCSRSATGTTLNVPTVASAGFNGFRSEVWIGLVAPAGTPADVVAKIEESVGRALRDPNVKAALEAQGLEPAPSNPAALKALMQEDMVRWSKVIKDTGARAE